MYLQIFGLTYLIHIIFQEFWVWNTNFDSKYKKYMYIPCCAPGLPCKAFTKLIFGFEGSLIP